MTHNGQSMAHNVQSGDAMLRTGRPPFVARLGQWCGDLLAPFTGFVMLETAVLAVLKHRGTATACPSDVARALEPKNWRPLMDSIRTAAARLQSRGEIDVYQHGKPVMLTDARGPIRLRAVEVKTVDYRREPHRYRIGRGEEGVLTVQPYKGELLPLWRFATPRQAKASASGLWKRFQEYGRAGDFVGMDMARKYLQMGFTRARRYANHTSGRKYIEGTRTERTRTMEGTQKAESAEIFRAYWQRALKNRRYLALRRRHEERTRSNA